jgi:hypothetical protein
VNNLDIVNLVSNLAIAAIFIWAWLQERKERQDSQRTSQERIDALTLRTLELIRDLTRQETLREMKRETPGLVGLFSDLELARAMQAMKGENAHETAQKP